MTRITVLHVEDEPSDRLIMSSAFRKAAPDVDLQAVVDGDEAIEYLGGRGAYQDRSLHPLPRVVLLDIKLPKRSGLEVLRWMRQQPELRETPVFVMTSSSEPSDLDQAYSFGANSYLVKTVDLKSMREIVRGISEYAALVGSTPAPGIRLPAGNVAGQTS